MINTATGDQRQHFEQQGFVVVRNAIDKAQIQSTAGAFQGIIDRAADTDFRMHV